MYRLFDSNTNRSIFIFAPLASVYLKDKQKQMKRKPTSKILLLRYTIVVTQAHAVQKTQSLHCK